METNNFFEQAFWEIEYKELLEIFHQQLSLALVERDLTVIEEMNNLRCLLEKKTGLGYHVIEKILFEV